MRRAAVLLAALAAALCVALPPAAADDTVVVPGLAFPSSDTYLTYFGCADLCHARHAPPAGADRPGRGRPDRTPQLRRC